MKLLIEIPDNKAASLMEVLNSMSNVKVKPLTEYENTIEFELTSWQKEIIEERLKDYYKNPSDVADFDQTLKDIEKNI